MHEATGKHIVVGVIALIAVLLAAIVYGGAALAGEAEGAPEPKATLGQEMPGFTLNDSAGERYSLDSLRGKIVVLAFTSQKCPYSREGDTRLPGLAKEYQPKGVVFLSIDSHKDTTPEEMAEYANGDNKTGEKLPYPILKDKDNTYADAVGAKQTPELYIVDKEGVLVYHGGLDNQKKPDDEGYVNYVKPALDELLSGKPVSNPRTSAYGCSIKRIG